jgi:hypothetical protein
MSVRRTLALCVLVASCSKPGGAPKPLRRDPLECGDKAVMARFDACKAAAAKRQQAPCEAAGGTWGWIGLHVGCNCPTGQGGCPCTAARDCLAKCVYGEGGRQCSKPPAEGNWYCAPYHDVVGCHCSLNDDGKPSAMCID